VKHTQADLERWHDRWEQWHEDNKAYVRELEGQIRRAGMHAEYSVKTFKSADEFQEYLSSLAEGWQLHSFAPGVVQWAVAVFVKHNIPKFEHIDMLPYTGRS
jgi:hypothetical protein